LLLFFKYKVVLSEPSRGILCTSRCLDGIDYLSVFFVLLRRHWHAGEGMHIKTYA
jgi:hypothetical protein